MVPDNLNFFLEGLLTVMQGLIQLVDNTHQFQSMGPEIFANHAVVCGYQRPLVFDLVKLFLELIDVFPLRCLHLLHDFLLSVQFTVQVLGLAQRLIDLVLELN